MDTNHNSRSAKHASGYVKPLVGGVLGDFKAPADSGAKKSEAKIQNPSAGVKVDSRRPIRKI